MKSFLFVLGFILILFGLSLWYYRYNPQGGFNFSKISFNNKEKTTTTAPKANSEQGSASDFGSLVSSKEEKYRSLEIVESSKGALILGKNRIYFGVAKTESGGTVSIKGNWSLSNSQIASLSKDKEEETIVNPIKEGKGKLTLTLGSLKAEKEIEILGNVLGISTTTPTLTPSLVKVVAINIYDPDGRRLVVGDSRNFTARVLKSDGKEYILDVDFSLSSDLGTLSRTKGKDTDFKALKMGSGSLIASYQGITASLSLQVN